MFVKNAVGRYVPTEANGKQLKPFAGAFANVPNGYKKANRIPKNSPQDNKILQSIDAAIEATGLKSGMTISFHHHLRNGDYVINMVLDACARKGLKDLIIAPTALFPVHEPIIEHIKNGVVRRIEGSMNGPVGEAVGNGLILPDVAVLRSHGGRVRAIEDGDLPIDVAFLAAPAADKMGNSSGLFGHASCGSMSYAFADAQYADQTVIVTDTLMDYPLVPISLPQSWIDYVVPVDCIGDHTQIISGTTRITNSPTRLKIAEDVVRLLDYLGVVKDGFSFQAGAGGISLAIIKYLGELMDEKDVKASFAIGGITQYVVDILEKGRVNVLMDAQCFDLAGVESIKRNINHIEISTGYYANLHSKGNAVNQLDVAFLGATEIDVDFNVNVNTHSDGKLLHGIGGHTDVCAGSKLTLIVAPLFRSRIPVIRQAVTTVTAPGETVDVFACERGIAINPRRTDLLEQLEGSGLPIVSMESLLETAESICGKPEPVEFTDEVVALIEYRDGTIIDAVRKVKK